MTKKEKTKKSASVPACHQARGQKPDYLLWGAGLIVCVFYLMFLAAPQLVAFQAQLAAFSQAVFEIVNKIWWGVAAGALMVGILSRIPQKYITAMLGRGGTFKGVLRAALAGILLDLCSHGILMVGAGLYRQGASAGQVMAFLIASPWNSLSLTLVLVGLIGLPWTLAFVLLSMAVALVTGVIFDALIRRDILPPNPYDSGAPPEDVRFRSALAGGLAGGLNSLKDSKFQPGRLAAAVAQIVWQGLKESRMVLRWLLFGIVLAAALRSLIPAEHFSAFFGPTLAGLGLTLIAATVIEVCSEGSAPIAGDLLTRAGAPGNSFAFLMTGVSTDYTEIMVLKDVTRGWKIPLFLPLITVPQIVALAWMMNGIG